MLSKYESVINSDLIAPNDKYYWGYQYRLGYEVLVPYLNKNGAFKPGYSVAEIGSAEGGVLAAFVDAGATEPLGTDIVSIRLEKGRIISKIIDCNIFFELHNIITEEPKQEWIEKYDLVILRDVIEHLDDTKLALSQINKIIKPGGFLYVTFPPYYSPFGGHQHTVNNFWGKFPFIHYLPNFIFYKLIESGRENDIYEVKRLQNIRLTPKKFINSVIESGFEIFHKDFYFLRPVYKMKFGLPTVKSNLLSYIPFIKNVFCLEASYILKKR